MAHALNTDVFQEDSGLFDQIYAGLCEEVQLCVENEVAFDSFMGLFDFEESARELQRYLLELCSSFRDLHDLYLTDTNGSLERRTKLYKAMIVKFDMNRISNRSESSASFLCLPCIVRAYDCLLNKELKKHDAMLMYSYLELKAYSKFYDWYGKELGKDVSNLIKERPGAQY
jgi:hypothetical protein